YPRARVVWGAFAAGTLFAPVAAHADCALPSHKGAVDPGAHGIVKKASAVATRVHAEPLPGKILSVRPPENMAKPKPGLPGQEAVVVPPAGGGARVVPAKPSDRDRPSLDGD